MAGFREWERDRKMLSLMEERNSLLAEINESLKVIASKGISLKELYEQMAKDAQNIGKSALSSTKVAIDSAIRGTDEATQ